MPVQLDGPQLAPASGEAPKQLVIFLHGYGADGNDLIGFGREWARILPDAAFVSPNAPEALPSPFFGGRQWFGLDTRSEREWEEGVRKA
ncbi:MAG: phospholipase, partial [Rhodomicrobium sp.]|nr:phospholipase [Rhodomicrobium sp.]